MEAYLVVGTIFLHFVTPTQSINFTLTNNCPYTIWPAAQDGSDVPSLENTGFALNQGDSSTLTSPPTWMGRLWARTLCGPNGSESSGFGCATGDCGTGKLACYGTGGRAPVTVMEFVVNRGGNDYYDISLVDGYNLPVTISRGGCPTASCAADINALCLSDRAVRVPNGAGVVGCQSDPSLFKSQCPQASASNYTDTFTCPTAGADNYQITFCPSNLPQYLGMLCIP